jgi:hypothetical protein
MKNINCISIMFYSYKNIFVFLHLKNGKILDTTSINIWQTFKFIIKNMRKELNET